MKMEKLQFDKSIIEGVEIKRCRKTPHSYKMHLHNELSLGYIEEGTTCVTLGNKEFNFKAGDGMIIPPLMSHMCCPDDINNWQTVIIYIDLKYYEKAVKFDKAITIEGDNLERLKRFIDMIDTETDKSYLENRLVEILLDFGEPCDVNDSEIVDINSLPSRVLDFLVSNYKDDIQLNMLEKRFGINRFTIIRNFKRAFNTTPRAYQLQLKVAEAKNLLAKGVDVFDICQIVGFYDQAHFIREFKKMHGITPLAYKQELNR